VTVVIRTENCARSMMPAFKPYSDEIVPNVRPVLISRVVYMACGRTNRRLTGRTPTNFAAILTAKKPSSNGIAPSSAVTFTLNPPLRKKNGVRKENATTRKRLCCSGLRWNTGATASPSRNAGSTACLCASCAVHIKGRGRRTRP
jgi:hypothetical protein